MAKLVVLIGNELNKEWEMTQGEWTLGRQQSNKLVVTDPRVSRRHFSIQIEGDQAILVNHSVTSGTYVNGIRVDDRIQLDDADQILAGETTLAFYLVGPEMAANRRGPADSALLSGEVLHEISLIGAPVGRGENFDAVSDPISSSMEALGAEAGSQPQQNLYKQLVLIQEVGKQLVAEFDLKALFEMILEKVFELMSVDIGSVLLYDEANKRVLPAVVRNKKGPAPLRDLKASSSMVQHAVLNRVGVLSSDTQRDERFQEQMSVIARGIRSAMCVPMVCMDELLGAIYIDNVISNHLYTKDDLNLLLTLANQAAIAIRNAKLHRQIVDEETKRSNLSRYLTPQLVEQIANNEFKLGLGGEEAVAALLFSDIRGFTHLSESMAPEDVVSMLNAYFSEMTDLIFKYNGTLDKFVGDEVIAAFGSPVPDEESCSNALKCAAAMIECVKTMTFPGPKFEVGIGLHYGKIIHGNVGSERVMQYTIMGDTVNTTSRYCDMAAPGQILMSQPFRDGIGYEIEANELEPVQFKGKSEPIRVLEFAGFCAPTIQDFPAAP